MGFFVFLFLLLLALISDWVGVYKNNQKLVYFAKPAVMIVLIAASVYFAWPVGNNIGLFIMGLIFSLIGDILLMLPKNWFVWGLLAFLAAHISYILALDLFPISSDDYIPTAILVVLLVVVSEQAIRRLSEGLRASGKNKLIIPVGLYIGALALLCLAALSHFYKSGSSVLVSYLFSAGAILFIISDLQLAWDRFVEKIPNGKLNIHISYHLAQIVLTAGFLIKYT